MVNLKSVKCDYCLQSITDCFIVCKLCPHVRLCLACFSLGAEGGEHKKSHGYTIKSLQKRDVESSANSYLFSSDRCWTSTEEIQLLEALETFGYGNWNEIASQIGSRNSSECVVHYNNYYLSGTIGKHVIKSLNLRAPCVIDQTLSTPHCEQHTYPSRADKFRIIGYLPNRDEFEHEYLNNAESILTAVTYKREMEPSESALQLALVDIYNHRLQQRMRCHSIALTHGLIRHIESICSPAVKTLKSKQSGPKLYQGNRLGRRGICRTVQKPSECRRRRGRPSKSTYLARTEDCQYFPLPCSSVVLPKLDLNVDFCGNYSEASVRININSDHGIPEDSSDCIDKYVKPGSEASSSCSLSSFNRSDFPSGVDPCPVVSPRPPTHSTVSADATESGFGTMDSSSSCVSSAHWSTSSNIRHAVTPTVEHHPPVHRRMRTLSDSVCHLHSKLRIDNFHNDMSGPNVTILRELGVSEAFARRCPQEQPNGDTPPPSPTRPPDDCGLATVPICDVDTSLISRKHPARDSPPPFKRKPVIRTVVNARRRCNMRPLKRRYLNRTVHGRIQKELSSLSLSWMKPFLRYLSQWEANQLYTNLKREEELRTEISRLQMRSACDDPLLDDDSGLRSFAESGLKRVIDSHSIGPPSVDAISVVSETSDDAAQPLPMPRLRARPGRPPKHSRTRATQQICSAKKATLRLPVRAAMTKLNHGFSRYRLPRRRICSTKPSRRRR